MAFKSRSKITSPDVGMSRVSCSFASGAQEDGSFPDQSLQDGYLDADGYGMALGASNGVVGNGVYGAIRVEAGVYEVILIEQWVELISCQIQIEAAISKLLVGQVASPGLVNFSATDPLSGRTVKRSKIIIRVVGSAGSPVDLAYEDRINISLDLKYSSVQVKNRGRN